MKHWGWPTAIGGERLTVLALGAHADDIEIGCGGTLLQLLEQGRIARIVWVVFSADDTRAAEARVSAERLAGSVPLTLAVESFRDGYFPAQWGALKDTIEHLAQTVSPDLIFAPARHDAHQDHRTVAELVWTAFRSQAILEYEVPKYDGDLVPPNLFVPLSQAQVDIKVQHLLAGFPSQRQRSWFRAETFHALMRLRGIEAASSSGWAEGFHARKIVVG